MTLTPGQHAVARLYAAGLPRAEIGRRLGIAPATVHVHLSRIHDRTGIDSRRAMAAALPTCEVAIRRRMNALGIPVGAPVEIIGGIYAGRRGTFLRVANSDQVTIQVGGGTFALRAAFVRAAGTEASGVTQ